MLTEEFMREVMEERMPGCNIIEIHIFGTTGSLKVRTEIGDKVFLFNTKGIYAEQG
tara:strand:+ start:4017 stop:4184 length:168 start_codon:yes stop_codon:yes gene_type:complete